MKDTLTVVYNDTCPICAREVAGYRRVTERDGLPVDYAGLSEADMTRFGLTPDLAARRFHVVADGEMLSGVPAFAALWDRMPRLRWLARIVRLPGVSKLATALYDRVLAPALYALHRRRVRQGRACKIA